MKKQIYVIYHAQCPDGLTAAWAFYLKYGDSAKYIPLMHNDPLPEIPDEAELYILDFSFKRDVTCALFERFKDMVILDHHISAKEDLAGFDNAIFDMDKSGARLAFEYLYPDKEVPKIVSYVEDKDLWRFHLPESKKIDAYIMSRSYDFTTWNQLKDDLENNFDELVKLGDLLLQRDNVMVENICRNMRFIDFEGLKVPCVNSSILKSEVGNFLLERYPHASMAMVYYFDKAGKIIASLRSQGMVDVSKVALKYGGGGHKMAAGMLLPLDLILPPPEAPFIEDPREDDE